MPKVVCINGTSPEDLTDEVNDFLERLNISQQTSANIEFTHVQFGGRISFYAYVTYQE